MSMPNASVEARTPRFPARARWQAIGRFISGYGIVLSLVIMVVFLAFASESVLSVVNLMNILRQVSINGIMAMGMTFVILTAGIDLSIGSTLAIAGVVAGRLVIGDHPLPPILATLAGILTGSLFGTVNGALIARLRVPPFVATLGMMSMARGATLLYSGGRPTPELSADFLWLGQGFLLGIPVPVMVFAAVFLFSWIVLRFTVYGRWVYAVGGNPRSAKTSGINVDAVVFSVYVVMGALAGLVGPILASRTTTALPQAGLGYELDAIAAVVIGGTSLTGGVGSVANTLVGTLIIGVMNNGLDLMGVSSYYQQIVKGAIIVLAVLIDHSRRKNP
jgi:putative xylitol transport system permease protein